MMKNEKIKANPLKKSDKSHTVDFCNHKIQIFQDMITRTILAVQKYKAMDIVGASETSICIQKLELLYKQLIKTTDKLNNKKKMDFEDIITTLQKINNELSAIFRITGTQDMQDLITVAMGNDFSKKIEGIQQNSIFDVLCAYMHPFSYKVVDWKGDIRKKSSSTIAKNRIVQDSTIVEISDNLDCFDLARTCKKFQKRVYGIKVAIHNDTENKTIIISGVVDDITIDCTNHLFIKDKLERLSNEKPSDDDFKNDDFDRFLQTLTIKEILIYNNSELYQRFVGYINQINLMKDKPISQNVKEFISSELYDQRRTLIQLLMKHNDPEFQYMAYLLYDLLSNDTNGSIDTIEQTILFDSLPWNVRKYFRDAMKTTINYTRTLSQFDNSKIPIEQQICLLKTTDAVKEKAMLKLREVKAKSEDSGSKARQYLEGLLKIPFGIYKKEPILSLMDNIKGRFENCVNKLEKNNVKIPLPTKKPYSSLEIAKFFPQIESHAINKIYESKIEKLLKLFTKGKRDTLVANCNFINSVIKKMVLKTTRLCHSGKKNEYMRKNMESFIISNREDSKIINSLQYRFPKHFNINLNNELVEDIKYIRDGWGKVTNVITDVKDKLGSAVHGHDNAKRQLQRIIGQWLTGEQKGHCFGFEGPPGTGKTTLAKKGLVECLRDENGDVRPFAFIPIGGSSNGSTLCGHNYTYVGSTWGRIVDILMDKKCMNPIIFIDELDKVSRSEHGKEIIGILTHLVDETQNESFQDKYFTGIDLDLSKALFIFSYNEPALIDKILLDRIHRIKFDHLSVEDKLVIAKKYLLPEIYKKLGLNECVEFSDAIICFIIDTYTYEPGVRKLKEILYEILSEINLEILQTVDIEDIMVITEDSLKNKYLKDRHEMTFATVHDKPLPGLVTGLWANALGKGGIIPIECIYFPATNPLDFKLTGLQGDVMKESMNVAKSLAWKLTTKKVQSSLLKNFKSTKLQGVHIHCPEGATPKDGPSAGTAITVAIYSLLNNKKVKNDIALTGEMNLQGKVSAIGGLKLKILGGIKAGVKEFIYPKDNEKDFKKFMDKYGDNPIIDGIKFNSVENIHDVFKLVFV
jgi:ATP-dependent Lon protease